MDRPNEQTSKPYSISLAYILSHNLELYITILRLCDRSMQKVQEGRWIRGFRASTRRGQGVVVVVENGKWRSGGER